MGILQVLREHGFIDEANIQQFTINGKKYTDGILISNTSVNKGIKST
jgi:hypothetical protein